MSGLLNASREIPRHELIAAALELGIERPEALTQAELQQRIREVSEAPSTLPESQPTPAVLSPAILGRGWFSVARHLVASVIEKGLNLPTAARVLRDTVRSIPAERPPLPTVTLAQIYIAQGHAERAISTLEQVLRRDPKNPKALRLWAELSPNGSSTPPSSPTWAQQDALVVLHAATGSFAYWELSRATWDRHTRENTAVELEVRASLFTPGECGAKTSDLVVPVRATTGMSLLTTEQGPFVRAAIGRELSGRWTPLAVATTYRLQGDDYAPEFTPRKAQLDRTVVARAARALQNAASKSSEATHAA